MSPSPEYVFHVIGGHQAVKAVGRSHRNTEPNSTEHVSGQFGNHPKDWPTSGPHLAAWALSRPHSVEDAIFQRAQLTAILGACPPRFKPRTKNPWSSFSLNSSPIVCQAHSLGHTRSHTWGDHLSSQTPATASPIESPFPKRRLCCPADNQRPRAALCPHLALPPPLEPGSSSLNSEIVYFIKAKAELAAQNRTEGSEGLVLILLSQGSCAHPRPGRAVALSHKPGSPSPQRPGRGRPALVGVGPTPRPAAAVQPPGLPAPGPAASARAAVPDPAQERQR